MERAGGTRRLYRFVRAPSRFIRTSATAPSFFEDKRQNEPVPPMRVPIRSCLGTNPFVPPENGQKMGEFGDICPSTRKNFPGRVYVSSLFIQSLVHKYE